MQNAVKPSSDAQKPSPIRRAVSTLAPPTLPDRERGHLPMNLHPPKTLTLSLAGGLAGASSNDHAAAKLSRQLSLRCAALLASHPCHPSPPPEPFLSPGAGDSLAHGRHLGLKITLHLCLSVAAQAGPTRLEARDPLPPPPAEVRPTTMNTCVNTRVQALSEHTREHSREHRRGRDAPKRCTG